MRNFISIALVLLVALYARAQERTNTPAPAATAPTTPEPGTTNASTNEPYRTPEGRIIEFAVPLTPAAKTSVLNSKNPPIEIARAAIAVPPGFDRDIPTPILLVCGTSDGDGSSIRLMPAYTNVALRLGWIVIAADGPLGKPANDNPPWRWAMVSSLLEHIHKNWPRSRTWPIVVAGISGGGKWAGVLGAILTHRGYNLAGVFMGGVNEDYASEAAKLYNPAVKYKQVPIYLSSGTDDKLATPQHHNEVKESLLHNGFASVRLETFKGGHALSELELRKALRWFLEQYGRAAEPAAAERKTAEPE